MKYGSDLNAAQGSSMNGCVSTQNDKTVRQNVQLSPQKSLDF